MKKVKVTFWLLGFGCGIALAGMIGTLLTLRIDVLVQQPDMKENNVVDEVRDESQNHTKEQSTKESTADAVRSETSQDQLNSNQVRESNKGASVVDNNASMIDTQQEVIEKYYEVFIPNNSGASEICAILEEAGIVESGEDFLEYIRQHKMQTRLKNGTFKLPMYTDYETLLALLLV